MKEMLKELLIEYQAKLDHNKKECMQLMKEGKEWQEHAKKGAGLKLMIETTILELAKYSSPVAGTNIKIKT